jgi:CRISPR-associated protein Cas6/Cse3/CasE subtype I-E
MQNNTKTSISEVKLLIGPETGAYQAHQAVWSFIGQSPNQNRHFHHDYMPLNFNKGAVITVRAETKLLPNHSSVVKLKTQYEPGEKLTFFLSACATITRHNRKEFPCLTREELVNWIQARSSANGFSVHVDSLEVDTDACLIAKPAAPKFYLNRALYSGDLTVTDNQLFAQALVNGIGRHKGLGFGMLKIINH